MERMCDLENCDDYRGFDIGYCHRLKVILNSQMKKEFFSGHCEEDMDIEMIQNTWKETESIWDPES
jgi:hypothetical protein